MAIEREFFEYEYTPPALELTGGGFDRGGDYQGSGIIFGGGGEVLAIESSGGGGGGSTRPPRPERPITLGGAGTTVISGCTDRNAKNYNPNATKDDGRCIYNPPPLPVVNDINKDIVFNIKTEGNKPAGIFVDGMPQGEYKLGLTFKEKALLTPKIITAKTSGNVSSNETFRIKTVQRSKSQSIKPVIPVDFDDPIIVDDFVDRIKFEKDLDFRGSTQSFVLDGFGNRIQPFNIGGFGNQAVPEIDYNRPGAITFGYAPYEPPVKIKPPITFGNVTWTYYELIVEKKTENGDYVFVPTVQPIAINGETLQQKSLVVPLFFSFKNSEIKVNPTIDQYSLKIQGDVTGDIIRYQTSEGQTGFVSGDNVVDVFITKTNQDSQPFVKFTGVGITDYTHNVKYKYENLNNNTKFIEGINATFLLEPGNNLVTVKAQKGIVNPSPNSPIIRVENENIVFNIANSETVSIDYSTRYADRVIYTLGTTQREIGTSGVITLRNEDFLNGVGRYVLYLQPISERDGSGELKKVVINVQSKAYLPGPDITHINYPQTIKGADFKEYNVNFDVSWQSINTDYILIYAGKVSDSTLVQKVPRSGNITLNVATIIRLIGSDLDEDRDKSIFKLLFIPYNAQGDELTDGKVEEVTITFDKGDLRLRRADVINDLKSSFLTNLDSTGFDDYISPILTHYLHIGSANNQLIGTWGIDDKTFSEEFRNEETNQVEYRNIEKSLVLKLYEPLPANVTSNDRVWISKVYSIPLIDQITLIDDVSVECTPLTPNFNLDVGDDIGYQILDDLVSSGSTTSTEIVNQFISSSDFSLENLNINFVSSSTMVSGGVVIETTNDYNWKDFVKYSSAVERVENFYYKIKLINQYESKYNLLTSGSSWTGSVSVINESNKQLEKINDLKKGFDAFEKFLFESSSADNLTYPKTNNTGSLINAYSSSAVSWYNGALDSATTYDELNTSRFTYNLPQHIQEDDKGQEFVLFFDMVGQHFDILWTHIKGISQSKKSEDKFEKGITNDLVYHMLESLGWDADMGVQSQFLWEYAFGKHSDGTEVSSMSGKQRQNEVWRRLLNNLPYLYKHKGTKRALHAALSCYGIPASLLTVIEFGGPRDVSTSGTTKFTFEDRTAAINISGSQRIDIPWKEYTGTSEYPNSVELRFNTDVRGNQQLISGSNWSLNLLADTGSLAKVQLVVGSDSASTDPLPFFNDEYTQIVVNRETGSSDTFEVFVKEGFQERIRNQVSASLTTSEKGWTSGSYISIGGTDITGSVDEFRLWTTAISESKIDNHTLLPDAIDGNHVSSSTEDLIFRLDFEYPKNRSTSGDPNIKNVSINRSYGESYATASDFDNNTTYPYHYTPYDRTVTADVPSSGFNFSNKVRFESQTKLLDLSYRTRATKKSYDQSPIDSDRLGLFFSPIKEINMDILKSLGSFNIDNYIGNPQDEYSDEYTELKQLRNYYFDRYNLNLYEYIQLVRYIDKSLFETLESLVPARAKVSSGLLIEPHILERNKTKWNRPTSERKDFSTTINIDDDVNVTSTNPQYSMSLDVEQDVNLYGTSPFYSSTIDAETDVNLVGTAPFYSSSILAESDINLFGEMTVNSGSDMGGIVFNIDAKFTGSLTGQYDSTKYQQIGMEPNSISRLGFGLYGENGNSQRTYFDQFGNIQKDRVKIYLLKQSYTEDVPQNIDSNDSSRGREFITQTKYKYVINILPFTGSDGNEMSSSVGGDIVEVTPLNGYFPLHYRNVGDLTSGLENSFFNGSKQTSATTLDGGSPVQTFTTNPNTLRVNDSGRGSGEPILEVD